MRNRHLPNPALAAMIAMPITVAASTAVSAQPFAEESAVRPFHFRASDEALSDLVCRVKATKWPGRGTVSDASQGVQLATMQKLARYWSTEYDWRRFEARLNALPQFVTTIDGLDTSFMFVRGIPAPSRSSSRTGGRARSSSSRCST